MDSSFQSMFKNFTNLFESSPQPRKLVSDETDPAVQEVKFTDKDGNLKNKAQIKQEIEQKFHVKDADDLGLSSVLEDLAAKGMVQSDDAPNSRKLAKGIETKLQRAMNMGLGGEVLSQNPEFKEDDSVRKAKNFVEFENTGKLHDHVERSIKTKRGRQSLKSKSWGSHSVKHRIGENGLKTVETTHKTSKMMKRTGVGANGESSFQEMSFSSSSSDMNTPDMKMNVDMPEVKMGMFGNEDQENDDMFFPEEEIQKMNELHSKMLGDMQNLYAEPEEFTKVAPPRQLRLKKRSKRSKKNRRKRRKNKRAKNRKLNQYNYDYPESVYGYNSHIIENPVNCPNCSDTPYVPDLSDLHYFGPNQQLDQYQDNSQNMEMNQQNNYNNINHHHHHYGPQIVNPMNIKVDDYNKMEQLYQQYLLAVLHSNQEIPSDASPRAMNKYVNVLQHQLHQMHHNNPGFGQMIEVPPMVSTHTEMGYHIPQSMTVPVEPKTIIHNHYVSPNVAQYTLHAPVVPAVAPTPVMIHNYEMLMDAPHPMAGMVMAPQVEESQTEITHEEIQHVKKDLEIEFKNDIQVEVGKVMKHEDEIQKHTDQEIQNLENMALNIQGNLSKPAPALNVEHTVMGVNGHEIHETKDGEIIVQNGSGRSHGGSSGSSPSSMSAHTEVIEKVTPLIIGNPGGFGGGSESYSGNSSSLSSSYQSRSPISQEISHDKDTDTYVVQDGQVTKEDTSVTNQNNKAMIIQGANNTMINDSDEDVTNVELNSVSNTSNVNAKNSIYNEKNTHIVHHMGPPHDSKTLNIHLNLLSDGKGGFFFEGKDGKPVGTAGTLADKYDVLNHQLDTIRVSEAEDFKQTGEMSKNGKFMSKEPLDNQGDDQVVTQINTIDDLHQIRSEDIRNIDKSMLSGVSQEVKQSPIRPGDRQRDSAMSDEVEGLSQGTQLASEQTADQIDEALKTPVTSEVSLSKTSDEITEKMSPTSEISGEQMSSVSINEKESQVSEISGQEMSTPTITDEEMSTQTSEPSTEKKSIKSITPLDEVQDESIASDLDNIDNAMTKSIEENMDNLSGDSEREKTQLVSLDEKFPSTKSGSEQSASPQIESTMTSQKDSQPDELNTQTPVSDQSLTSDIDDDLSENQTSEEQSPQIFDDSQIKDDQSVDEDDIKTDAQESQSASTASNNETEKSVPLDVNEDDIASTKSTETSVVTETTSTQSLQTPTTSENTASIQSGNVEQKSMSQELDNIVNEDMIKTDNDSESNSVRTEASGEVQDDATQNSPVNEDLISEEKDVSSIVSDQADNQSELSDSQMKVRKAVSETDMGERLYHKDLDEEQRKKDDEDIEVKTLKNDDTRSERTEDNRAIDFDSSSRANDLNRSNRAIDLDHSMPSPDNSRDDLQHMDGRKLNLKDEGANPFKTDVPIFQTLRGNFMMNQPRRLRSVEEMASDFDHNREKREKPVFVEPRELFENLDVTAKLRAKMGLGGNGKVGKEHRPLF